MPPGPGSVGPECYLRKNCVTYNEVYEPQYRLEINRNVTDHPTVSNYLEPIILKKIMDQGGLCQGQEIYIGVDFDLLAYHWWVFHVTSELVTSHGKTKNKKMPDPQPTDPKYYKTYYWWVFHVTSEALTSHGKTKNEKMLDPKQTVILLVENQNSFIWVWLCTVHQIICMHAMSFSYQMTQSH